MCLVYYYPYYSCLCTFWPYHPYLFLQFISCLYLFVFIFLSSTVTESEGCGLVHSLWRVVKARQTKFAVYHHRPHGFSDFLKNSYFRFNTVNIQHFEPHPLSTLISGRGLDI